MVRRARPSLTFSNAILLAVIVAFAQGCAPTADGAGLPNKPQKKGGGGARKGGGRGRPGGGPGLGAGPGAMGAAGMPRPGDTAGMETATGYIMKGTDMLVFWPCGKTGYYFLVPTPVANARIAQDYKFSIKRPYATMYAELTLRYVDDSISRGSRHYERYAQVLEYTQRSRQDAACRAPRLQTVSDEMQKIEAFRVDALLR